MRVYKKGSQIVVSTDGVTKKDFIPSFHSRMEFNSDNTIVTIRDIGYSSNYINDTTGAPIQESFSCLISALQDEFGTLVGNYAAVETYLCDIIGS